MSVAEAKRQKKAAAGAKAPRSASRAEILDRDQMQELFRRQREELRQNRERIKKTRDGARDPELLPKPQMAPPPSARRAKEPSILGQSRRIASKEPEVKPEVDPDADLEAEPEMEPDADSEAEPRPKLDLSQALNRNSTAQFIKSRSKVLSQLYEEEEEEEDDAPGSQAQLGEDEVEQNRQLDGILEQAKVLNDALDNLDDADPVDAPEPEPSSVPFFLQNKVLNFPVVRDSDSLSYRAEAIRAFLEREIGLDRLLALKQAVSLEDDALGLDERLKDCEPGVVVLAQQLLVLEETIDAL
jgi:hypothetical protein